jgi:flagellar basal body rod protein FlgC
MSSTSAIAQTGLQLAALSLDVSANNAANVLDAEFDPSHVAAQELPGGGVSGDVVKDPAPPADPLAEVRADHALLATTRVDLAQEMVNQSRAAALYKANLETLRTSQDMERTLIQGLEPA